MKTYWIRFEDGTESGCDGQSASDAVAIAEHFSGKRVEGHEEYRYRHQDNPAVRGLPYNTSRKIWTFEHPVHGKEPAFCHRPQTCAGHTSCQNGYACTE